MPRLSLSRPRRVETTVQVDNKGHTEKPRPGRSTRKAHRTRRSRSSHGLAHAEHALRPRSGYRTRTAAALAGLCAQSARRISRWGRSRSLAKVASASRAPADAPTSSNRALYCNSSRLLVGSRPRPGWSQWLLYTAIARARSRTRGVRGANGPDAVDPSNKSMTRLMPAAVRRGAGLTPGKSQRNGECSHSWGGAFRRTRCCAACRPAPPPAPAQLQAARGVGGLAEGAARGKPRTMQPLRRRKGGCLLPASLQAAGNQNSELTPFYSSLPSTLMAEEKKPVHTLKSRPPPHGPWHSGGHGTEFPGCSQLSMCAEI